MERSTLGKSHPLHSVDAGIISVTNKVRRSALGPHFFLPLAFPRPFFDLPAVQIMNGGIFSFFFLPFFSDQSQYGETAATSGAEAHRQQLCHQGVGGADLALQ